MPQRDVLQQGFSSAAPYFCVQRGVEAEIDEVVLEERHPALDGVRHQDAISAVQDGPQVAAHVVQHEGLHGGLAGGKMAVRVQAFVPTFPSLEVLREKRVALVNAIY